VGPGTPSVGSGLYTLIVNAVLSYDLSRLNAEEVTWLVYDYSSSAQIQYSATAPPPSTFTGTTFQNGTNYTTATPGGEPTLPGGIPETWWVWLIIAIIGVLIILIILIIIICCCRSCNLTKNMDTTTSVAMVDRKEENDHQ